MSGDSRNTAFLEDENDALRSLVSELRADLEVACGALEPFIRHGRAVGALDGNEGPFWIMTDEGHRDVPREDFMNARAALNSIRKDG